MLLKKYLIIDKDVYTLSKINGKLPLIPLSYHSLMFSIKDFRPIMGSKGRKFINLKNHREYIRLR